MANRNKYSLTTKSHSTSRVNPYDKISLIANIHCPDKKLPKICSNLKIELYSFIAFVIALSTQYLNLYRSQPVINYHLIDFDDVSQFSIIFIGQSALICFLKEIIKQLLKRHKTQDNSPSSPPSSSSSSSSSSQISNNNNNNNNSHHESQNQKQQNLSATVQQQQLKPPPNSLDQSNNIETIVTATASWICNYYLFKCAYRICFKFGNGVSFILLPIIVSIIMDSAHIIQVVEGCRKVGMLNLLLSTPSMTLTLSHIKLDDDKLCHNCSNQPDEIRDEVERLRTIFNDRLKFVLFKSLLLAYYSSFVPLCFAQSFLYYDYTWTAQHVVITWFSSLIMLISSSYTPHFYDVLHRSAYHFGRWQKLEARNTLVPSINWSENVIYPRGIVVKHYRGYFRSESVSNCARPGEISHIVISNPKIGYAFALGMLAVLLTIQMYLLVVSTEWYKLMAMTNMMLINIHSIYRLVKSFVVITKIYKEKK